MAFCSNCGNELRGGLRFCTKCGAAVSPDEETGEGAAGGTHTSQGTGAGYKSAGGSETEALVDTRPLAPTIVIGAAPKKDPSRGVKSFAKGALGFFVAVAIIIIGVWTSAWVVSNFDSNAQIEEVDNTKSKQMLALVDDVRNPNFDDVIDDLLSKKGKAEDYSFLEEYTAKFNEILGDEYTEEEKLFCDCCYYVWYTEYEAKRYEWLSNNSGLLNYLYVGKADRYRKYADTLYEMLTSSKSDTDLKNIKIYCVDHKIINDTES
ncbi:MAG: zinc ribbon domain-containing protein [Clostridia bacterium]|nr:zinc ribbon domain-containing protein [Clostridia bacterium]